MAAFAITSRSEPRAPLLASALSQTRSAAGIQLDPTFVKLIAWYDNEWADSSKLLDLALKVAGE
jgi:glyceraldehyde-3-phosphate dehydrogenase/erythrose-4-phosphate dehydrogenase